MEEKDSSKERQFQSEQIESADEPPLVCSTQSQVFKNKFYPNITPEEWGDWKWQIRNSITSYEELSRIFGSSDYEVSEDINLPLRITPYYASTISDPKGPIGRCVVPSKEELIVTENEESDSLHEEQYSPLPNLVHRYPDRVLFLTTDFCSSYCRYCTRSHMVSHSEINKKMWDKAIEYIRQHTEVRDVLLSGGDLLTMDNDSIEYLLKSVREIEHVEFLRIGTKIPVVLPQRITPELCSMLKKYHPLFISIHFSHPDELTPEVKQACERLADAGIPLGSQTVLLKGVNDDVPTMKALMHGLLKIRVRPYYIYACDLVPGTSHFRTKVSKGIEIIQGLRGWTTGYAVPQFVVDAPGGGGKIPLLPEYYMGQEGNKVRLRNYEGKEFIYIEN
jgi:lysine 2,3-aminomutase